MKKNKNGASHKYKTKKNLSKKSNTRWQSLIAFFLPFLFFTFSFNLRPGIPQARPVKALSEIVQIDTEKKLPPVHQKIVETKKILPAYLLSPKQLKVAGKVIYKGSKRKKKIALTFDDGPTKLTLKFLKVLSQENAPATFFLIGWRARDYPELVKKISLAGHEIGVHTYSHSDLSRLEPKRQQKEIVNTLRILKKYSQQPVLWIRPPYGKYNVHTLKICKKINRGIAFWTIDSNDYKKPGIKKIWKKVLAEARNGSIILMHETSTQTLAALPKIIGTLKKQGYELVTFSQLVAEY